MLIPYSWETDLQEAVDFLSLPWSVELAITAKRLLTLHDLMKEHVVY